MQKAHSQLSEKFADKFCSVLSFQSPELTILRSRKNATNMFCLIMKIFTEKKQTSISVISFFASSPILSGLSPKTL